MDLAEQAKVFLQRGPHALLGVRVGDHCRRVVDIGGKVGTLHHLGKQQRPGAGHDLVDGVAATAERQPPALAELVCELVEGAADMGPDARGRGQVRKRVEVVPRAWTIFFAEMVERPDLAAGLIDASSLVPGEEAQERVWAALRTDIARLGEVHGLEL